MLNNLYVESDQVESLDYVIIMRLKWCPPEGISLVHFYVPRK